MIKREFEVDAPIDLCFQAAADVARYPEFLKATKSVQVFGSGNVYEAEFTIDVMKPIVYRLRFETNAPKEITWTFVKGEVIKGNEGYWRFTELSESRTKVEYGIQLKFGLFVPKSVEKKLTEKQLPGLIHSFSKRMLELAARASASNRGGKSVKESENHEQEKRDFVPPNLKAERQEPRGSRGSESEDPTRARIRMEFEDGASSDSHERRKGSGWEDLLFSTFEKIASAPSKLKDPKDSMVSAVDWVRGFQKEVQDRVKDEVGQRLAKIDWNVMSARVADHLAKNYRMRVSAEVEWLPKTGSPAEAKVEFESRDAKNKNASHP